MGTLCLCACGSSDDATGGGKTGTYTLGGIVVDANSVNEYYVDPNDMSYGEQNAYKQKISDYGTTIVVNNKSIDFDGLILAQYNSAKYSMQGRNIIFSSLSLKVEFTYATLENGVLSLCYTKDLITPIVFEYYSADYVAPSYKITFDYGNNNDASWTTEKEVQFNAIVGELPTPQIDGYTFSGWTSGYNTITEETKFKWKKDITLNAVWSANTYKVTYEYNEATSGNYYQEGEVRYNSTLYRLPTPSKTGYIFGGWFTEQNGAGQEIKYDTVWTIANDATLYANWISNEFTVTFDYQGTQGNQETKTVYYDTKIGELPQPTKEGGNTFGGWFTEVGGGGVEYTAETIFTQTKNVTLYAKWNSSVAFDYDGATNDNITESMAVVYNAPITEMPRPHKEGYSFDGWFSDNIEYRVGSLFSAAGTITLKVKWIEGTDKDNFTYSQSNSGVTITGLSEKGENLTTISIPAQIDSKPTINIASNSFSKKSNLQQISLSNSLLKIGTFAFEGTNISTVVVPESVTEIGSGAFLGCPLTEITIPFVGYSATTNSSSYREFGYIFGKYSNSSQGCTEQYSGTYLIPQTLTKVTVTRADGLKSYGFYNCTMLTEIVINSETKTVPTNAFYNCGIVNFIIPNGVTTIARGAFQNCQYLETFGIPLMGTYNANNHSYLNYLFGGTEYNSTNYVPSQLKTVIVTGTATTISPYAFYNCANLNFITIDHEIASIGQQAFKGCASLKAITLNSSVPTLGNDALMDTPDDMILRVSDENKADYQVKWNMDESRICGQNKSYVLFESRGGSAVDALFVNNGDTIIEPIVPRRSNYIFLGWYSDIKLQNKFDFSMPIDRDITLYAKWQYQSIELDTEVTIDMNNYAGETYYFTFTPETSGYFTIRSYGTLDTTGILYNASGSRITSNTNGGTGISPNFSIRYQLTAGTKYIIGVKLTSATATGEFSIMISNG